MRAPALISCIAAMMFASGCAARWDVDDFTAPEANLTGRQAFFWRGGEVGTPAPISEAARRAADAQLHTTIVAALEQKGYRQVADAKSAQLIVSYQISGQRRYELADDRRVGAPSPTTVLSPSEIQPPPASALPREVLLRDGSVMIFVDDATTGKIAWRGVVNAELRIGSNEEAVRVLDDMARQIMAKFPGNAATQ